MADLCGFCSKECIMLALRSVYIRDLWRDDARSLDPIKDSFIFCQPFPSRKFQLLHGVAVALTSLEIGGDPIRCEKFFIQDAVT